MVFDNVKSTLSYIINSDFVNLSRGIQYELGKERPNFVVDEGAKSPSWIQSNPDIKSIQIPGKHIRYYSVLEDECNSISISTERPFTQLDFRLITTGGSINLTLTCDCRSTSGDNFMQTFDIKTDLMGDYIPVTLSFKSEITEVDIDMEWSGDDIEWGRWLPIYNKYDNDYEYRASGSEFGIPIPRFTTTGHPIILITVDSVPHSQRDGFETLIESLGDDLIIPAEPRTQGKGTAPAHASIFTGVHPGTHHHSYHAERDLHPDFVTLGEVLYEMGYLCSTTNTHTRILPEFGFGRGFYRYDLDRMDSWITREVDVRTQVQKFSKWLDQDYRNQNSNQLFYFMHVYDPHSPYVSPPPYPVESEFNIKTTTELKKNLYDKENTADLDYIDIYKNDSEVDDEIVEILKEYQYESIKYVSDELTKVIKKLKYYDIFDESLIIITADHGEEFGERGFCGHSSLYDPNIRPMTLLKPPASTDWNKEQINKFDHIDILPTIAKLVGNDVPEHCQGVPLQEKDTQDDWRISERMGESYYNISIEKNELKAIFTYRENDPHRPDEVQLSEGPRLVEFYDLTEVREGNYKNIRDQISSRVKKRYLSKANEFIRNTPTGPIKKGSVRPTAEVDERLKSLGYK